MATPLLQDCEKENDKLRVKLVEVRRKRDGYKKDFFGCAKRAYDTNKENDTLRKQLAEAQEDIADWKTTALKYQIVEEHLRDTNEEIEEHYKAELKEAQDAITSSYLRGRRNMRSELEDELKEAHERIAEPERTS